MNWAKMRLAPWLDTRAKFVAGVPRGGSLLDIGSSDGETLRHFFELRPDLRFHSTDLAGMPENYPTGCRFHRGDIEKDRLPWPDASMSAITCMHLVEHLNDLTLLLAEVSRLLMPGGRAYFETPHPKTVDLPRIRDKWEGAFTMNFFDDPTHTKPVPIAMLAEKARAAGLEPVRSGISRNLMFAASHLIYRFARPSRAKFTAQVHWIGWSAYLILRKPG